MHLSRLSLLSRVLTWDRTILGKILPTFLLGDNPVDCGFTHIDQIGNFPDRFPLFMIEHNGRMILQIIVITLLLQVLRLLSIPLMKKMDITIIICDFINNDIIGIIDIFTSSYLHLFDKLDPLILCRLSNGKDVIKEVVEFLGASQVVLGNGVA